LNGYCQSGVEEDKAEVFAEMFADYGRIKLLARGDGILDLKVNEMIKFIAEIDPEEMAQEACWEKVMGNRSIIHQELWGQDLREELINQEKEKEVQEKIQGGGKEKKKEEKTIQCPFCLEDMPSLWIKDHVKQCSSSQGSSLATLFFQFPDQTLVASK